MDRLLARSGSSFVKPARQRAAAAAAAAAETAYKLIDLGTAVGVGEEEVEDEMERSLMTITDMEVRGVGMTTPLIRPIMPYR